MNFIECVYFCQHRQKQPKTVFIYNCCDDCRQISASAECQRANQSIGFWSENATRQHFLCPRIPKQWLTGCSWFLFQIGILLSAVVNSAHVPVKEMSVSILQIFIQNFVRKHFEIAEISSYLGENFLTPSMRFVKCRRKMKSLANHYA